MKIELTQIPVEGLSSPDNPFQTAFWAAVKRLNGWDALAFSLEIDSVNTQLLVLTRKIFLDLSIAYIPYGPQCSADTVVLKHLSETLRPMLPRGCFVIRYDVPWEGELAGRLPAGVRKNPYPIQPEGTVIVSLEGGPDAVFSRMRTRARRNVRRAQGEITITSWEGDPGQFHAWYETYTYTSLRDSFIPRTEEYMHHVLDTGRDGALGVEARLYLAWIGDSIIGGNIVLFTKQKALYLFGSSRHEYTGASPSYALQWHTIEEAVKRGCREYDLYGIAPDDEEDHHLHSLTLFKTGFGGQKVFRAGCFDVVCRPLVYHGYRLAELVHLSSARG